MGLDVAGGAGLASAAGLALTAAAGLALAAATGLDTVTGLALALELSAGLARAGEWWETAGLARSKGFSVGWGTGRLAEAGELVTGLMAGLCLVVVSSSCFTPEVDGAFCCCCCCWPAISSNPEKLHSLADILVFRLNILTKNFKES